MKNWYTIYLANLDTLEVFGAHRQSVSANQARKNILRLMRDTDSLHSGDRYRIMVVEGRQSLHYPSDLFDITPICVAR